MRTISVVAVAVVLLTLLPAASAASIVVDPANMNGWATTNFGTTATSAFVAGAAPSGAGYWMSDSDGPVGTTGNRIYTGAFSGTAVSQIRSWDYTAQQFDPTGTVSHSFSAPYTRAFVDLDGDGTADDRLTFEPYFQQGPVGGTAPKNSNHVWAPQNGLTPGGVPTNTWFTWDLLGGAWYSGTGAAAGNGQLVTMAGLVADFGPLVSLLDSSTNVPLFGTAGTVQLQDGFNNYFNQFGYFDTYTLAVAAGSTTYDFEPLAGAAVPLPSAAWCGLGLLMIMGAWRRRSSR